MMIAEDANLNPLLEPETRQHQKAVEGMVPPQQGTTLDLNDMAHMRGLLTVKGEKYMRQQGRLQLANGAGRDPGDPSATNEEQKIAVWILPSTTHLMMTTGVGERRKDQHGSLRPDQHRPGGRGDLTRVYSQISMLFPRLNLLLQVLLLLLQALFSGHIPVMAGGLIDHVLQMMM